MKTIKIKNYSEVPKNYTGVVEYYDGYKEWWIEGKRHRIDGPAVEYPDGVKCWWIENYFYSSYELKSLIQTSIYLEKKQKGKYGLDWLRFLTDQGIKEFPFIPGMEEDKEFKPLFNQVFGAPIT